jgi:predicted RNase H-like HicB family nuclease
MTIPICVEEIEARWIAHVPDLPGCFAALHTRHSAIEAVPAAIHEYSAWCSRKGLTIAIPDGAPRVEEIVRAWISEDDYEVNAFFAADRPALSERDTMEIARILDATREDLSAAAARFAPVLEPRKSTGDDLVTVGPPKESSLTLRLRRIGTFAAWGWGSPLIRTLSLNPSSCLMLLDGTCS